MGPREKVFGLRTFAIDMEVDTGVGVDLHLQRGASGTGAAAAPSDAGGP